MHRIPCLCAYASSATAGLFDLSRLLLVFIPGAFYTAAVLTSRRKNRSVVAPQLSGGETSTGREGCRRVVRLSGLLLFSAENALGRLAEKLNAPERAGGGKLATRPYFFAINWVQKSIIFCHN